MAVSSRHVLSQTRVIGALARTVARSALAKTSGTPALPGPEVTMQLAPLREPLIDDFIRLVGGEVSAYKGRVPPHLFPQWTFPVILRALEGVPYPAAKIVNAGCTLKIHGDIPRGEELDVSARLANIDDNGRRALITVSVRTGTRNGPNALEADFRTLVPLKSGSGGKRSDDKPRIAEGARAIGSFRFSEKAGLDFAKVTGDFNPIHWIPRYAKAMGFRNVILHGFGSMAWTVEGLNRGLFAGNTHRLKMVDANFTRPLVLPGRASLFVWGDGAMGLGAGPGGPAYMLGRYAV